MKTITTLILSSIITIVAHGSDEGLVSQYNEAIKASIKEAKPEVICCESARSLFYDDNFDEDKMISKLLNVNVGDIYTIISKAKVSKNDVVICEEEIKETSEIIEKTERKIVYNQVTERIKKDCSIEKTEHLETYEIEEGSFVNYERPMGEDDGYNTSPAGGFVKFHFDSEKDIKTVILKNNDSYIGLSFEMTDRYNLFYGEYLMSGGRNGDVDEEGFKITEETFRFEEAIFNGDPS